MPSTTPKGTGRSDLLDAALEAFVDRGYEGTSVGDLATATGLSKAAFVYHFQSKEELLFELSEPLLDDLDKVIAHHETSETDLPTLLGDYLDALCRHHQVAAWVDGDKSILNHGDLGGRLDANNRRVHRLLTGPRPTVGERAQASAVLGMLWRPVRNGYLSRNARTKATITELAALAATSLTRRAASRA